MARVHHALVLLVQVPLVAFLLLVQVLDQGLFVRLQRHFLLINRTVGRPGAVGRLCLALSRSRSGRAVRLGLGFGCGVGGVTTDPADEPPAPTPKLGDGPPLLVQPLGSLVRLHLPRPDQRRSLRAAAPQSAASVEQVGHALVCGGHVDKNDCRERKSSHNADSEEEDVPAPELSLAISTSPLHPSPGLTRSNGPRGDSNSAL
mmetsp:Transcript_30436/g.73414  ORF Transcript_30436/g.73414 Transcript_30436/m.73414 type:complete len:203 (-) Transcript_30436:33-641(-)